MDIMANYYLAIDLGASGGRHILGHVEEGKLVLEEIYRFANAPEWQKGPDNGESLVWDTDKIYGEICAGIVKCGKMDKKPLSIGIDTWGVDYVLADRDGNVMRPAYAYRDGRTEPFIEKVAPYEDFYRITGIAPQPFNTIYQVMADKAAGRLDKAEHMLQLPEYFSALLAGNLAGKEYNEYTMASTTGLMDAGKKTWAEGIFKEFDLPLRLFKPVKEPPYDAGELNGALKREAGFSARVVMVASHDTASAVATVAEDALYISSGTWSLLGVYGEPILNPVALNAGYTNEGAHNGRIRFLKNIMGLWVIQQVRHELDDKYSFAELEGMARETAKHADEGWQINVNANEFFNPPSMIEAVQGEYRRGGQKVPQSPGELAYCVYTSLAKCYHDAIGDLEKITGKQYPSISIIGGGSKDGYLNALTADYTGKTVYAGPSEATALGNILLQMKQAGDPAVEKGFSELVKRSFDIKELFPNLG
jgi:rhamnulokinase